MNYPRLFEESNSPNQPLPTHLVEVDRVIEALANRARSTGSQGADQLNSIIDLLELGAIHPVGAMRELTEDQAETVRRVAVCCLIEVSRRLIGGTGKPA